MSYTGCRSWWRSSLAGGVALLATSPAWTETPTLAPERLAEGKERFETRCGTCHSLALPQSQRLDRGTWEWVISDMVNQFGATWLTEEDQALILDYLVSAYGPKD
jgi:mono/diheme cytochrome c family protein